MNQIKYTTSNGQVVAKGELGKEVLQAEGNFYFDKSAVNLELLKREKEAYFCPIKSSSCDYFYLQNSQEIGGREIAWVYEKINNSLFGQLAGKIGFYAHSSTGLDLEKS